VKKLIYGIYGAFVALTALTIFIAVRAHDGLVDEHYYEKAEHFFDHRSGKASGPECALSRGPCAAEVNGKKIVFDITPKPVRAMQETAFKVNLSGGQTKADLPELTVDLGMPGMYMGTNKVLMKKTAEGQYEGKGIIPRCPSGRNRWMATVHISEADSASFLFNVAY
jgi:hypothetical protein